jgi:hypothetical protein
VRPLLLETGAWITKWKNLSCKKWSQTACSEEREEEEKLLVPLSKRNKNEFKEPTTTHTDSRGGERRGEEVCALGVDQLVIEHLSIQGRLVPREGLCCFWCPNLT